MRVLVAAFTFTLLAPLAASHAADGAALLLADGGKALQSIVIAAHASDATKAVAAELADYLGRISGTKFEIATGDGSQGIVLGTLAEFPNPSLTAQPWKFAIITTAREAFAIRTGPTNRLLLIGRDGHGRIARGLSSARTPRLPLVLPRSRMGSGFPSA